MNTKWLSLAAIEYLLDNDATRFILTQPLQHRIDSFTRYVPFKREGHANWKARL
jgi:hypothetical protein